jgi:mRNA interferase RelE/StbE
VTYSVQFVPSARRAIDSIPKQDRIRIAQKIDALASNPFPPGSKKLADVEAYRIRVGNYRVIYEVARKKLIILALRIAHRKDVYR